MNVTKVLEKMKKNKQILYRKIYNKMRKKMLYCNSKKLFQFRTICFFIRKVLKTIFFCTYV